MIANVKAKRHGRVDFRVVDLLGRLLMKTCVVSLDLVQIIRHRVLRIVRIQKDQAIFLHAHQIVGLFRTTADDATVQLLHEKGLDWAK